VIDLSNPEAGLASHAPTITAIKTWPQVVAIIVYAFVQITTSMNPDTAPYSFGSLAILAFLAFYIIRSRKVNKISFFADFLRNDLELLGEFRADMIRKRNDAANPHQTIYDEIINEIDIRVSTTDRVLRNATRIELN